MAVRFPELRTGTTMDEPDRLAMEHAALAAWPARETEDHDGWILRASDGVTKRANSATVLAQAGAAQAARIACCEDFYRTRGLPCIFRLPSFVDGVAGLDHTLADREYRFLDLSLVLHRSLVPPPPVPAEVDAACGLLARDGWLDRFAELAGLSQTSRDGQAGILQRIHGPTLYAVRLERDAVVCAGLGVMHGERLGLFDVVTRTDRRGRGLARGLITWLMQQARARGARTDYLQVVGDNLGAIALYEGLGFRRIYHYWYRMQPPR